VPSGLVKGIAALLLFDETGDAEATALQQTIEQSGVEGALVQYAGLDNSHPLVVAVKEEYKKMQKEQ
jgi:mannitol-1-phosphate 5-dehydrogenase